MRSDTVSSVSKRLLATAIAGATLLSGCATDATRADAPKSDKVVERRAVERWDFLIARQAEKAYDYLSPGFRATKQRDEYAREMNNRPVRWSKVLPYRQVCDKPDVCVLDLQIDFEAKMPGVNQDVSSTGFVKETWIRSGGKWYLLPSAEAPACGG
jgi:hypothetical protein